MRFNQSDYKRLPRGFQQPIRVTFSQQLNFIVWSAFNLLTVLIFGLWFGAMCGFQYDSDFMESTAMTRVPGLTRVDVVQGVWQRSLESLLWLALPLLILWFLNFFIYTDDWRAYRKAGFWVSLCGSGLMFLGVIMVGLGALARFP